MMVIISTKNIGLYNIVELVTSATTASSTTTYLSCKPGYSQLSAKFLKFCCHGNQGRSEVNLNDTVELAVPENHTLEPKITTLCCIQRSYESLKNF